MSLTTTCVALADVAELNPRLAAAIETSTQVSFVPMAAVTEVTGEIVREEVRSYSEVAKGFTPFKSDDVIVAKITPCFQNGKIAHAKLSQPWGFGSTEFHVVRADTKRLLPRYVFHFLRQDYIRVAGERRMTGSAGQRRVPLEYLAHLEIPLPPLSQQKRIAEILDRAEALRAKRRAALALLDELTQSIFLDMFGDPVGNTLNWKRVKFGDILENIDSGWSPQCLDRPVQNGEWGVLKLGAVTWGEFDAAENKALPPGVDHRPELEVKVGDLLFTRKNTYNLVAACALVRDTPPQLMLPDLVFRFRMARDAEVEPVYLQRLLVHPSKRREIQKLAGGSSGSMPNISKSRLETVQIELPPMALQRKFASQVNGIEEIKEDMRESMKSLDQLFASLQHRAFRGDL